MPINLRYGQQAVARGFISQQRLQQVLSKQKTLADKGKKVSVRMILEKAKLLDAGQLAQIDRDLNIKVVKKKTGRHSPPAAAKPKAPTGAQNFQGDVPEFGGPDVDVTLFSPPPADMQDRIRQEREKAKADSRQRKDEEAGAFFGSDDASPFGGDPFADDAMVPDAQADMQPEPMDAPQLPTFGDEMQPEPEPFSDEMRPEPDSFGDEMQPEAFGDGDTDRAAFDEPEHTPQELSRMDSSPKLSSLAAEHDGFASPEDEELPVMAGFDSDDEPAAPSWQEEQQPSFPGPPSANLSPAGDDFADFGNDIRSPEELESGASRGSMDATLFSPAPGSHAPREKTGAMDRTMFSPPPPGFHPRDRQAEPEPEPEGDAWGESGLGDAGFGDEGSSDATLFSPPPMEASSPRPASRESQRPSARGRQGSDDFADIDLPTGKRMDDVPTAPAQGDTVHPLRRGMGSSSSGIPAARASSRQVPAVPSHADMGDEMEAGEPIDTSFPESDVNLDRSPPSKSAKKPGKLPTPKSPAKGRKADDKRAAKADKKSAKKDGKKDGKEGKKTSTRVILLFLLLLVVAIAVLIIPVEAPGAVPPLDQLRKDHRAAPVYDHVEDVYDKLRDLMGMPRKPRTEDKPAPQTFTIPAPEESDPAAEPPANEGG